MINIEAFESVVRAAKVSNDFMLAWEKFVNTRFYVAILTQETGSETRDFRFVVHRHGPQNEPMVFVSEDLNRLRVTAAEKAIQMSGAELLNMLNHEVGIVVVLSDGGFGIPVGLVAWLRASMQAA